MNWKFWKKPENGGARLSGPKDLPQQVGRELVVAQKLDPDWVWNLKCVSKPKQGEKNIQEIRIYSPSAVADAGIMVRNYHSLDGHPELILYDGQYDKAAIAVRLEKH